MLDFRKFDQRARNVDPLFGRCRYTVGRLSAPHSDAEHNERLTSHDVDRMLALTQGVSMQTMEVYHRRKCADCNVVPVGVTVL